MIVSMKKYLFVIILVVSGCSSNKVQSPLAQVVIPPAPTPIEPIFGKRPEIISKDKLFELNASQKKHFLDYFNRPGNSEIKPNIRIYQYLKDYLKNFNFHTNTFTAEQSLNRDSGNCLTLAILTSALSKIAKVESGLQLVQAPPVYQRKEDLTISSQHVRTLLYNPQTEDSIRTIWNTTGIIVDYFPVGDTRVLRGVEYDEFIAMYYRNKATEAIVENKLSQAYWYVIEALEQFPTESDAVNTLAVIYERSGQLELARTTYEYGLKYSKHKLELLSNYYSLLKRLKKYGKAREIAHLLESYKDPNPFRWIDLGHKAYKEQNYDKALRYYRRANKLAPYLHEGYAGIARVRYQQGDYKGAQNSINLAINNTFYKKARNLYQEKLSLLTNLLESK